MNIVRRTSLYIGMLILASCSGTSPRIPTAGEESFATIQDSVTGNLTLASQSIVTQQNAAVPPEKVLDALLPKEQTKSKTSTSDSGSIDERFDVSVSSVPARTFFMGLVEGTTMNMIVHPSVTGEISLNLKNVTLHEVLETVRNVFGYDYSEISGGYEILPIALQTKVFNIAYINVDRTGNATISIASGGLSSGTSAGSTGTTGTTSTSGSGSTSGPTTGSTTEGSSSGSDLKTSVDNKVWSELTTALKEIVGTGEGRRVATSPNAGIVIVRGMPDELRRVEEFIKKAEGILHRQVVLEAKVMEVVLNDAYQTGINWGALAGRFGFGFIDGGSAISGTGINLAAKTTGIAGNTGTITPPSPSYPQAEAISAFGGTFSLTFQDSNFATFVEFLSTQGNVQVLSNPRVSTANNQKAIIKVGTDEFYVTNVSTTTTSTSAGSTSTPTITFQPFFSGVALDVTPNIDDEGYITLHVHPSISTVTEGIKTVTITGATQSIPLAINTIRETDSIVRAKNGEIVVIGGLMGNQTVEASSGVPFFEKLPFIGAAFRHVRQESVKSELVILLKATVVDSSKSGWAKRLQEAEHNFEKLDRGFYAGARWDMFGTKAETPGK